jgi:hypothetical protein
MSSMRPSLPPPVAGSCRARPGWLSGRRVASSVARCAVALGVAAGLACPQQTSDAPAETRAPCKEVGQRCEFAPGKLGSCVVRDNCHEANCFVCQSQH